MDYVGTVIRPPSEANAIILQVSLGCSHNSCLFCTAYKDKNFKAKEFQQVLADINFAAANFSHKKTVFLADGDAIALSQEKLVRILIEIKQRLPWVKRINSYASPKSLLLKSPDQLAELRSLGLKRLYLGVESGLDEVLNFMDKGATAEQIVIAGQKAIAAKFYLSCSVIIGLAGPELSEKHAIATAEVLNKIKPQHIGALTLMIPENSGLEKLKQNKNYTELSTVEILEELKKLIMYLDVDRAQFHANHASNHLPIYGQLSRDKEVFIQNLDNAIAGKAMLMPDYMRSL